MNTINLIEYDSSDFADIKDSISHSKTNKLVYTNISKRVVYNNEFTIDTNYFFDKYATIIDENTTRVKIDEEYFYKPEYLSKKIYGTVDLWHLVLFTNAMTSPMDFNRSIINVFSPDKIHILNKLLENDIESVKKSRKDPFVIEDLTIDEVKIL